MAVNVLICTSLYLYSSTKLFKLVTYELKGCGFDFL